MVRVLFIHGLESGPNGLKAQILRNYFEFFSCPHLETPKNLWSSFAKVIQEVRKFKPDIIIGSSYGSILLMLMLQMGIWKGPSIVLACAMQLIAKHRMFLPHSMNKEKVLLVHGKNDSLCDIESVRKMAHNYNINLIEIDDRHSLKSICVKKESETNAPIITFVNSMIDDFDTSDASDASDTSDAFYDTKIEFQSSISTYLFKLTLILFWALIRYPFNLCLSNSL